MMMNKEFKENYKLEQLKYARLLLEEAKADKKRLFMHNMYKVEDSFQITNGYIAVVLKEPIEGLEVSTDLTDYFDCRTVINRKDKNYYEYDYDYKKVKIDLSELEKLVGRIKNLKPPKNFKCVYKQYNVYYNPLYLLTAIKILGTNNVDVYFHTSSSNEPIYLKSDLGEGIVLPVKVNKEDI